MYLTTYSHDVEEIVDSINLDRDSYKFNVTHINVVGLAYRGLDPHTFRTGGNPLELIQEPENKFDPNAIAVYCGGKPIGYVTKDKTDYLRSILSKITPDSKFPALVSGETPTIFVFTKKAPNG